MVSAQEVQRHMCVGRGAGGGLPVGRELRMWERVRRCGSRWKMLIVVSHAVQVHVLLAVDSGGEREVSSIVQGR